MVNKQPNVIKDTSKQQVNVGVDRASQQQKALAFKKQKQAQGAFVQNPLDSGGQSVVQSADTPQQQAQLTGEAQRKAQLQQGTLVNDPRVLNLQNEGFDVPNLTDKNLIPPTLETFQNQIKTQENLQTQNKVNQTAQIQQQPELGILDKLKKGFSKEVLFNTDLTPEAAKSLGISEEQRNKYNLHDKNILGFSPETIGVFLAPGLLSTGVEQAISKGIGKIGSQAVQEAKKIPFKSIKDITQKVWNAKNVKIIQNVVGQQITFKSLAALYTAYIVQSAGGDFQQPLLKEADRLIGTAEKIGDTDSKDKLIAFKEIVKQDQAAVDNTGIIDTFFGKKKTAKSEKNTKDQQILSDLRAELNVRKEIAKKNNDSIKTFIESIKTAKQDAIDTIDADYAEKLVGLNELKSSAETPESERFYSKQIASMKQSQIREKETKRKYYNKMLEDWTKQLKEIDDSTDSQSEALDNEEASSFLGIF